MDLQDAIELMLGLHMAEGDQSFLEPQLGADLGDMPSLAVQIQGGPQCKQGIPDGGRGHDPKHRQG